jgi:hypothetical protein
MVTLSQKESGTELYQTLAEEEIKSVFSTSESRIEK